MFVTQEYTEEMERLRKDLQAARDKNGIFLAEDHYKYKMILCDDVELV